MNQIKSVFLPGNVSFRASALANEIADYGAIISPLEPLLVFFTNSTSNYFFADVSVFHQQL